MVNQIQLSHSAVNNSDVLQADRIATQPSPSVAPEQQHREQAEQRQGNSPSFNNRGKRNLLPQTTQAHYQTAQAQTAHQALSDAKKHLEQLRQVTRRSLSVHETKRAQLQQELNQLKSKLQKLSRTEFDSKAVLHHDLTTRLSKKQEPVSFSLKGLRLNVPRNEPEVLRFQLEGSVATRIRVEPEDSAKDIALKMHNALSRHDIAVEADKYSDVVFKTPKAEWPKVKKALWMSGGGQILPAGNMVKARLEAHDATVDGLEGLEFSDPKSTRRAMVQIEKMLQKVEQALAELTQLQQQVSQDLQRLASTHLNEGVSTAAEGKGEARLEWSEEPEDVSFKLMNNAVPVLLAQANASRSQVVALLQS